MRAALTARICCVPCLWGPTYRRRTRLGQTGGLNESLPSRLQRRRRGGLRLPDRGRGWLRLPDQRRLRRLRPVETLPSSSYPLQIGSLTLRKSQITRGTTVSVYPF